MKFRNELVGFSLLGLLLAGCTAAAGQLITETPESTSNSPLIDGYKLSSTAEDILGGVVKDVDNWFGENIGIKRNSSDIGIEIAHNLDTGNTFFDADKDTTQVFLPGDGRVVNDDVLLQLLTVNELSTARNFLPDEILDTKNPSNFLLADGLSTLDMTLFGMSKLNLSFEDLSAKVDNYNDYLPSQKIFQFLPISTINADMHNSKDYYHQLLASIVYERTLGSAIYDLVATDIHTSDNPSDWASTINSDKWLGHMLNERKEIATDIEKLGSDESLDLLAILREQVDNKNRFDQILQHHPEISNTMIIETSEKFALVGPYENGRENSFGSILAFYDGIGENNHTPKVFAEPTQQTSKVTIKPTYLPTFDATEIVVKTKDGNEVTALADGYKAKFIKDLDSSDIESVMTRPITINLDTNKNGNLENEEINVVRDKNGQPTTDLFEAFMKKYPELVKMSDLTEWKY